MGEHSSIDGQTAPARADGLVQTADRCRACGAGPLVEVLDLGDIPVADLLLTESQLAGPDPTFPLRVGFCADCALVQIVDLIDPDVLYSGDYPYFSSVVPGLVEHFTASAQEILGDRHLTAESLVIEAASNDGYMLRVFTDAGVPVLGVDPANGPAQTAIANGVPTIVDFFSAELARRLRDEGTRADVVIGNNVLNLVPDPSDFAAAADLLLTDDGEVVLEVPYVVDAVTRCEYDNFFHQNCSYFSLTALQSLFARHGLTVRDVRPIARFGSSLRVWLARDASPSDAVRQMLDDEAARGVGDAAFYRDFASRARRSRELLIAFLAEQRQLGKKTVAYGAAGGMATTLLSFAGVDGSVLEYAVDVNQHKHGLFTPGSRLEVFPPERLLEDQPDFVLLLAWNYADEIIAANDEYQRRGGRFVVPIPEPHVVSNTGGTP